MLIVGDKDVTAYWDVSSPPLPVSAESAWLELVTGKRFDVSSTALAALDANEIDERWKAFANSESQFLERETARRSKKFYRWRRSESIRHFNDENWYAARFHAEWALKRHPDDPELVRILNAANKALNDSK